MPEWRQLGFQGQRMPGGCVAGTDWLASSAGRAKAADWLLLDTLQKRNTALNEWVYTL
jgi:hypothetical protein